jgi:hypothetical protein
MTPATLTPSATRPALESWVWRDASQDEVRAPGRPRR